MVSQYVTFTNTIQTIQLLFVIKFGKFSIWSQRLVIHGIFAEKKPKNKIQCCHRPEIGRSHGKTNVTGLPFMMQLQNQWIQHLQSKVFEKSQGTFLTI